MEKIKAIIASDTEEGRYALKNLLTTEELAIVAIAKNAAAVIERTASIVPEVVILYGEQNISEFIEASERLYISVPSCVVILLMNNPDRLSIERAMSAGIRKVIEWPCDTAKIVETIKTLLNVEKMRTSGSKNVRTNLESKIITVFGTKGGIGKTTTAVNTAVALAQAGNKVAIIDLDLQFGDVGVFLDLEPKDTIAELVAERGAFDIDSVKSFMVLHSSGVSVLTAPKSPEYAEIITADHIEKIINTIRPYFDYVIIDTPPAFNDCTLMAIEHSNAVLFVVTLDISTLRNAKISNDVFSSLNQKEKVKFVINRDMGSGISVKDAQKVLGAEIFFKITCDWKVALSSLNRGVPISSDAPRSVIAGQFRSLAKKVTEMREQ